MISYDKEILAPGFSHIYLERDAAKFPLAQAVLEKFPHAIVIPVRHYKDIFTRPRQDFAVQKASQQLVLAVGRPPFLYRGSDLCPSFGNPVFNYASSVMNCIFNCEYCYLQGMYPSGNMVIFVNIEDIFMDMEKRMNTRHAVNAAAAHDPLMYLCNSYDTDLLALGNIVPIAEMWLGFAAAHPGLLLEMRTKSAATSWINRTGPVSNVIIAWTFSPQAVAGAFEAGAPPVQSRLKSAKKAMEAGWRVRVCIDPVLFIQDWQVLYASLVRQIFRVLDPDQVEDVSFGVFRMGKGLLKRARKVRPGSALLHYPFSLHKGVYSYEGILEREMMGFISERLEEVLPAEKIFPQTTQ